MVLEMKIGIFSYFQNQIIGISYDFNQSDHDSLGVIDSSYTHVEYRELLKSKIPELQSLEYDEISLGRVIYNSLSNKIVVYMNTKL